MKPPILVIFLAFGLGGAAGAAISVYLNSRPSAFADSAASAPAALETVDPSSGGAAADGSPTAANAGRPSAVERSAPSPQTLLQRLERALATGSDRRKAYEVERLFEQMTAAEAPALLEQILTIPGARKRGGALRPFFVRWGELEGPTAYAAAQELDGRDRGDGISASLAGWAQSDVLSAWAEAETLLAENSHRMAHLTRGVVDQMAKQHPDTLIELVAKNPGEQRYSSISRFVIDAAFESDQPGALPPKLDALADAEERRKWIGQIYQRWGELDTGAPLDAMAQISDPEDAKGAMEGFLQGWVQADRVGALDYAFENQSEPAVEGAFAHMLGQSIQFGTRAENAELIDRVEQSGLLDKVGPQLISQLSFQEPTLAMRIAERISDTEERRRSQQQVVGMWAQRDYNAARAYYDQVPSPEEKAKLAPSLIWPLMRKSDAGVEFVSLLETLPAGKERSMAIDRALQSAASGQARPSKDFLEALKLATESDPGLSPPARKAREKLFGAQP